MIYVISSGTIPAKYCTDFPGPTGAVSCIFVHWLQILVYARKTTWNQFIKVYKFLKIEENISTLS